MPTLPDRSSMAATIPASAAFLRHLRVLAATVADDLGFDLDEIEALRIAVDELCALAIADAGDDATLTVTFQGTADEFVLTGRCEPVTVDPEVDPIAESLLAAGSSSHRLVRVGDVIELELRAARPNVHTDGA